MAQVLTRADALLKELTKGDKKLSIPKAAELLGIEDTVDVEKLAKYLKEYVEIQYPANILSSPYLKLIKELPEYVPAQIPNGSLIDEYDVNADGITYHTRIIKEEEELVPSYFADYPHLGPGTSAIITGLAEELTKRVPIAVDDIADQRKMMRIKKLFAIESQKIVNETFNQDIKRDHSLGETLSGFLLHNCYGLGILELPLHDNFLEEVCIDNAREPVAAYHITRGWVKTNFFIKNEEAIYNLASQIGRKSGTNITNLTPIMDAQLISGDRANATLFPVSSFGNTITIRRFARVPWTIVSLIKESAGTISPEMGALLWLCMQYELNVVVTGGTASGKTSMLNSICALVPSNQRIISIEETREIELPEYLTWNWIPMVTRNANSEGKGEVTMLDLLANSLRMRPDRVIMGEVRRREEAEVLFEAMHTGHSVYSTIHADTSQHLIRRLTKPPFSLPEEELEAVDLIVVQFRDRRRGLRRTIEIAELKRDETAAELTINYLYRWDPRTDKFEKLNEPRHLYEKINLYTGMDYSEIKEDLAQKTEILSELAKKDIIEINEVGEIINTYYADKKRVSEKIKSMSPKEKVQETKAPKKQEEKKAVVIKKPVVKKTVPKKKASVKKIANAKGQKKKK